MTTFVDIHILQTVPPSNINRDDTGAPKSAFYGGVRRDRVSSQAWKRAVRTEFSTLLDTHDIGERTLRITTRIAEKIAEERPDLADSAQQLAEEVVKVSGIKTEEKKKDKELENSESETLTKYLIFVSRGQIQALADLAIESTEGKLDKKSVKQAFTKDASLDVALFGRMIADDADLNYDATCQVAHAISVHPSVQEFDYFTGSDDNAEAGSTGAGMIGTVEFVSSTLYRYATVNADELAVSLGSKEAAIRGIEAFFQAFVNSMPTGKMNTFANRTRPDLVLVQVRDDQPVNLSGAFETAITENSERTSRAVQKLCSYATDMQNSYGAEPIASGYLAAGGAKADQALESLKDFGEPTDLNGLVELVTATLRGKESD